MTEDLERLLAGGEVLAVDPPYRFEQSFEAADLDDPPSRIAVTLEPTSGGTRVLLVHDRVASRTTTYRRFRRAHPLALSALKSVLETGRLPVRARVYTAIFKPGMKLLPFILRVCELRLQIRLQFVSDSARVAILCSLVLMSHWWHDEPPSGAFLQQLLNLGQKQENKDAHDRQNRQCSYK